MSAKATPHWPRLMKAGLASAYVGVSETKFYTLVTEGVISQPKQQKGSVVWDIRDLDNYADDLPKRGDPDNKDWNGSAI